MTELRLQATNAVLRAHIKLLQDHNRTLERIALPIMVVAGIVIGYGLRGLLQ